MKCKNTLKSDYIYMVNESGERGGKMTYQRTQKGLPISKQLYNSMKMDKELNHTSELLSGLFLCNYY